MRHWAMSVCLLAIAGCATTVPEPSPEPAPAEPITAVETKPAVDPAAERAARLACLRIQIAAVGDIMLGTDFPENHLPDDDGVSLLAGVAPVLSSADVAFGNLEGVLMDGGEPVKTCKDPDACYLFRSPARYAAHLAEAGIDVVSLANNHARDFGEEGRTATMAALDVAGIAHSGRVGDVATWHQGDLRVSLIAFAPFRNAYSMLDLDEAARLVSALARDHDVVIVSFHGGAEGADVSRVPFTTERYYGEDRGDVVRFSRTVVDAGADLVIGHGPHVPRAMELHRERLIAYSLGNFATYYGISVAGAKGYAPILLATLDGAGRFMAGRIVSAFQLRPQGPIIDDEHRAYTMMRELTREDFSGGGLVFEEAGTFSPATGDADQCVRPLQPGVE